MSFNKEKITRKSNLEVDDSLSAYDGHTCQQNHHCFEAFFNLLSEVRPARILEIGTALGGLTIYLKEMCEKLGLSTEIRTYDVDEREWYDDIRSRGIDLRLENIFNNDYTELLDPDVINYIQQDGVTLVLCDGGNKIGEYNLLSDYIKVSDIIMAHDYAYDSEVFQEKVLKKLWNWHEISESHILDCAERNNLLPYMQEIFDKAVWVCKIKK